MQYICPALKARFDHSQSTMPRHAISAMRRRIGHIGDVHIAAGGLFYVTPIKSCSNCLLLVIYL